MDNHELNKCLKKKAIELGLCKQWQSKWEQDWPQEKLIEKYYEGIDFCLRNNFPSDDFIQAHIPQNFLRANGFYINDIRSGLNHTYSIIKKESIVTLRYNASNIGTVYVTDYSELNLTAKNRSFVIVHALGNAIITAHATDNAKITVIQHSPVTSICAIGNTTIKREFEWLE